VITIAGVLIEAMGSARTEEQLGDWWRDNMAVIKGLGADDRALVVAAKDARKIVVEDAEDDWVDNWLNGVEADARAASPARKRRSA
jgi:hypothetical protein